MKLKTNALSLVIMFLISACGNDPLHRLAYAAVQGMGRDQCMDRSANNKLNDCLKTESYDDYQRKRQEVNSAN